MRDPLRGRLSAILPLALALALLLRLAWPLADPPSGMSWSGGPVTDPPSNVLAARYAVQGGPGRAIDPPERLIYPALQIVAEAAYRALGVRRLSTVLLAGLLGTATVLFLALALARGPGSRAAIVGALLAATSSWLVPHARVLEAELVPLLLLAASASFAMSPRLSLAMMAGALAAAAGFLGKFHALAFLPALVGFLAARVGWRAAGVAAAGGTGVAVAWFVWLFAPHRAEVLGWLRDSSVGAIGQSRGTFVAATGLLAPFSGLKESWLAYRMPIVAATGAWFSLRTLTTGSEMRRRIDDGSALFVFWAASSFLTTCLLSYTAPRYFNFVAAPLIACAACQIANLLAPASESTPARRVGVIPLAIWTWAAVFALLDGLTHIEAAIRTRFLLQDWVRESRPMIIFSKLADALPTARLVLVSLAIAAAAVAVVLARRARAAARRPDLAPSPALATGAPPATLESTAVATAGAATATAPGSAVRSGRALLAAALVFDLLLWLAWAGDRSTTIEDAKASLVSIVPANAVILGGFAPLLTEGTPLVAEPLFRALRASDLEREPKPTHLLMYGIDFSRPESTYPFLAGRLAPVERWPIRTAWTKDLLLFRLATARPACAPSDYELAIDALAAGDCGLADSLAAEHIRRHGRHPSAIMLEAACRLTAQRFASAESLYLQVAPLRPRDPLPLRNLGFTALARGDRDLARARWTRALSLDPSDEELAGLLRPLLAREESP